MNAEAVSFVAPGPVDVGNERALFKAYVSEAIRVWDSESDA
jgi:hypothetical protein